ncbi:MULTISPECIES: TadE/TadG family type IV pilus assembly protein [Pseudomonas aeruginosa group]|uniref:TadE/TadG family type IV pilus assembly protein n=1 Tax=Pseudomonas aeruginosa group TaxID=136841 RepID=UPI0009A28BA8|nr:MULTISPECIES: TadE/TadG family type IV pilus assembly protein [Pseudomonas aeruginosa group]MDK2352273.1 pilus assembly protein [Pseudomonas paraeruginosa]MEA8485795.1 pilus assembly protein [Pseudomonas aeruginosa]
MPTSIEDADRGCQLMHRKAFRGGQKGAVAIEFTVVFLLFFALIYGLISYSIPLLMLQSFNDAAAVGARAAVAVDPSEPGYEALAETRARDELLARLAWMPATWRANLEPCAGNGQYADYVGATSRIEVCVQYQYGDPAKAIIPVLRFPGIGAIPNLPQTLKASANLLL